MWEDVVLPRRLSCLGTPLTFDILFCTLNVQHVFAC